MSPMIQLQSASAEHRDVRRRYAASLSPFSPNRVGLVQPLCRLCIPLRCRGPVRLSVCFEARVALRGIWTQNSRSHIAMSYQPSFAWKASLRAHRRRFARPPSVLKPRWSKEPLNAASDLITTRWFGSDNPANLLATRLFASVAALQFEALKASR